MTYLILFSHDPMVLISLLPPKSVSLAHGISGITENKLNYNQIIMSKVQQKIRKCQIWDAIAYEDIKE